MGPLWWVQQQVLLHKPKKKQGVNLLLSLIHRILYPLNLPVGRRQRRRARPRGGGCGKQCLARPGQARRAPRRRACFQAWQTLGSGGSQANAEAYGYMWWTACEVSVWWVLREGIGRRENEAWAHRRNGSRPILVFDGFHLTKASFVVLPDILLQQIHHTSRARVSIELLRGFGM